MRPSECREGIKHSFNGHPPLGVNATFVYDGQQGLLRGFNGHPPLGVNATNELWTLFLEYRGFQWAPTLGGECYSASREMAARFTAVSMGTHPWG